MVAQVREGGILGYPILSSGDQSSYIDVNEDRNRAMKTYKIAAIPADGIGPEVIAAGLQALEALARRDGGFTFEVTDFDWSSERYKKLGA